MHAFLSAKLSGYWCRGLKACRVRKIRTVGASDWSFRLALKPTSGNLNKAILRCWRRGSLRRTIRFTVLPDPTKSTTSPSASTLHSFVKLVQQGCKVLLESRLNRFRVRSVFGRSLQNSFRRLEALGIRGIHSKPHNSSSCG